MDDTGLSHSARLVPHPAWRSTLSAMQRLLTIAVGARMAAMCPKPKLIESQHRAVNSSSDPANESPHEAAEPVPRRSGLSTGRSSAHRSFIGHYCQLPSSTKGAQWKGWV